MGGNSCKGLGLLGCSGGNTAGAARVAKVRLAAEKLLQTVFYLLPTYALARSDLVQVAATRLLPFT
ncbi:hypothetical protein [Chlorogloeopsis sp. ULAP02]|uniref:hypothetical protein n=1 Tax=Chlorogloeopsis sp. ULAP02 TaxID=3107926 RepID=UPI003136B0C9